MGPTQSIPNDPRLIEIIDRINEIDPILDHYNSICEIKGLDLENHIKKIGYLDSKLNSFKQRTYDDSMDYISLYKLKHDLIEDSIKHTCPRPPLSDKMTDINGKPITLHEELIYLTNERAQIDPFNKYKSLRRQSLGGKRKSRKNSTKKCKCIHKCKCKNKCKCKCKCKKLRKSRKKRRKSISKL
jgi:hypothetical protein